MFSNQRKSFFKGKVFYGMVILTLVAFGLWVNYTPNSEDQSVNSKAKVESETTKPTEENSLIVNDGQGISEDKADPTESKASKTTYLIREVDGVVKIFLYDEDGVETLYQITSIPFNVLSKEDQQLFVEGIRVNSLQELESYLENFDS
ncbi:MAG: hypothetical protein RSD88_00515 [Anaerovoracaceae bacterium]